MKRSYGLSKGTFFEIYWTFLEDTLLLKEDENHQDILAGIVEKTERGMDAYKAVMRVLPKHKHKFESLFVYRSDADKDSECVEDSDDQPPVKRMRPSEEDLKKRMRMQRYLTTCRIPSLI